MDGAEHPVAVRVQLGVATVHELSESELVALAGGLEQLVLLRRGGGGHRLIG